MNETEWKPTLQEYIEVMEELDPVCKICASMEKLGTHDSCSHFCHA